MKVFTIGFTKTSAERFFGRLSDAGVTRLVDVRLKNTSQLAGFAKGRDLAYFLKVIGGIEYVHLPQLAPSKEILDAYKEGEIYWSTYETRFLEILRDRRVAEEFDPQFFDNACLLCSESTADHCHRRLIAEHLSSCWNDGFEVIHL